jgi:hypothetical protein
MGMPPARRNTASSQSAPPAAMEARSVDAIPRGSEWQYEPKWDGFRCLLSRHGDKVELRSKSGEDLTRYFTELVEAARKLKATDFVLDGEIVVPRGKAFSFDDLLQRLTRKTTSCPPSRSAKGDKQPRRFLRQFFDAARGGMNPLMDGAQRNPGGSSRKRVDSSRIALRSIRATEFLTRPKKLVAKIDGYAGQARV